MGPIVNLEGGRVLFVCPSRASFGETHNAARAALSLRNELSVEPTVIARDTHVDRLSNLGVTALTAPVRATDSRQWLRDAIVGLSPDLIVLADHENAYIERTPFDNETLYTSGPPVIVFDSLQLAGSTRPLRNAIANVRGSEVIRRWWPSETVVPPIPVDIPILTPVPVANPVSSARPFALYTRAPETAITPREVRSALGISDHERLIVLSQSAWAAGAYDQLSRGRRPDERYGSIRARRLSRAIHQLAAPVAVLDIGTPAFSPHSLSTVTSKIDWRLPTAFTSLLRAADLFVTDNVTSGAAAQAAMLGTAILCLVNSTPYDGDPLDPLDEAMNRNFPGWGFPYLVNPLGWHDELITLRTQNAYVSSIPLAEVYDTASVVAALDHQLDASRDLSATTALEEILPLLPSPAAAIADAARSL